MYEKACVCIVSFLGGVLLCTVLGLLATESPLIRAMVISLAPTWLALLIVHRWLRSDRDSQYRLARARLYAVPVPYKQAELKWRYQHADQLLHQRISFWLVAHAALLAAAAQAFKDAWFVILVSVFAILMTLAWAANAWVISERINFVLHELKGMCDVHTAYLEAVSKRFPSGSWIMNISLPVIVATFWAILLACKASGFLA